MTWPNSTVYRAVSDKPYGPYVIADTIGRGHNPEAFRLKDGRYVLYAIGKCYIADTKEIEFRFERSEKSEPFQLYFLPA